MIVPTFSGLSEERLIEVLHIVRGIAALPDAEAGVRLDQFLLSLKQEFNGTSSDSTEDFNRERTREEINRLRDNIARVRGGSPDGGAPPFWDGSHLGVVASRLGRGLAPETYALFADEISGLRMEAEAVAAQANRQRHKANIQRLANAPIINVNSARKVIVEIDKSLEALEELWANGLPGGDAPDVPADESVRELARRGKERGARYRAQRKLEEAAVKHAGGERWRATRLRQEAAELLAQDWAQAFPGETPPKS